MKASIIIINYNDKLRVGRAIESALNQTYNDVEVVVVDDGSDDETKEIYKKYEGKISLLEIARTDQSARTPSYARNCGFDASTGEYVAFLDSDNYYEPEFIEEMIKEHNDVTMCNWAIIGKQDYKVNIERVWNPQQKDINNYLEKTHLDHQCLLVKRVVLKGICKDGEAKNLYDTRLPRSQDCDLIVRLMMGGHQFKLVTKKLFVFEKHEEDQMKQLASVHGKVLWTLKNDLPMSWLTQMLTTEGLALSYVKGINDFTNNPEWKEDYDKSAHKKMSAEHDKVLYKERTENVSTS